MCNIEIKLSHKKEVRETLLSSKPAVCVWKGYNGASTVTKLVYDLSMCGTGYFGRGLVFPRYLMLHRDKFSHKKEAPENSSHLVTLTLMTEQLV